MARSGVNGGPDAPRDAELVRRATLGDREAFAVMVERNRPMLVALCRRTLRDPLLAEDASQEAVLLAMLGLDRLRRPSSFGAWLGGVGLHVCRRMLRDQARETWSLEAVHGGRLAARPVGVELSSEEIVRAAELEQRVAAAVRTLPSGQRDAVALFYLSGFTQRETAEALGIGIGAAKARLHRAREALRERLHGWKEEDMGDDKTRLVRMGVADIRRGTASQEASGRHVVILEEASGDRRLPIWIGAAEATALALTLENVQLPRPMTYRFAAALLAAVGGRLQRVRINRLSEGTFYAEALLEGPSGTTAVDARPSDAINLALLGDAPIDVDAGVLEAVQEDEHCRTVIEPEAARVAYPDGPAEIAADVGC
jgi:RNA polymerase sigma factor (sigma-70 family)